jgi:hypothetical protein
MFGISLRKIALSLVFGTSLFAGASATASAQSACVPQGQALPFTYTSSFGTAGSAEATFSLSGNVLVVNYKNTSTERTYLTGVALNAAPHLAPESLAGATATGGWAADAGPGGGLGRFDLITYGTGKSRLLPGASGTAVFILASAPQEICVERTIVHLTSLPNGDSEKPAGVPGVLSGGGGGGGLPVD